MAIVVGVDGSEGAKAALRWAIEEARLRHATVDAVYAWPFPYGAAGFGWAPTFDQDFLDEMRRAAESALSACVSDVTGGREDVEVTQRAIEGAPAEVLLERAEGADLLVVGSRGHGGFKELVLGSVGHQCALHAPCPVVIVRPPGRG